MNGLKVMLVYSIAYFLVQSVNELSNEYDLLLDIPFVFCISVNLALVRWISIVTTYKTIASIILLVSLIASSTLIISQYIMWLWASDFIYNSANAIITEILLTLTFIDILSMIWTILNGLFNKSQSGNDDANSNSDVVIFNNNADEKDCSSGDVCQII